MDQLMMKATAPYRAGSHPLPKGYRFVLFQECEKDIIDWKDVVASEPDPLLGSYGIDVCYQRMIENYPDLDMKRDVHFIENESGERVATIATVTHADQSGYVHMVKAKGSECGKGLGHAMVEYALRIFEQRNNAKVILTTDDARLAAIKTYLDAGFCPVICDEADFELRQRWDAVLKALSYPDEVSIEKTR